MTLREIALFAIEGVGDETRGSVPDERTLTAVHVRRRLSEAEEVMIGGGACDIRGTDEALWRYERACRWMTPSMQRAAWAELTTR